MANFFYKTFFFETFTYVVDATPQLITDQLQVLFSEKQGLLKSPNLKGKFLEYPSIFRITPKRWWLQIRGGEKEPAFLSGIISPVNATQTKIEIVVKPNAINRNLFFAFLPLAVFFLIRAILTMEFSFSMMGLWCFVLALPVLFIDAKNVTTKLRKNFENYLHITPVEVKS